MLVRKIAEFCNAANEACWYGVLLSVLISVQKRKSGVV